MAPLKFVFKKVQRIVNAQNRSNSTKKIIKREMRKVCKKLQREVRLATCISMHDGWKEALDSNDYIIKRRCRKGAKKLYRKLEQHHGVQAKNPSQLVEKKDEYTEILPKPLLCRGHQRCTSCCNYPQLSTACHLMVLIS